MNAAMVVWVLLGVTRADDSHNGQFAGIWTTWARCNAGADVLNAEKQDSLVWVCKQASPETVTAKEMTERLAAARRTR
jgi:hypothetical protein